MPQKALISIIVPVYNESTGLSAFYRTIKKTLSSLPYTFEIIFIDDGSSDNSLATLQKLASQDSCIRVIEFARNFGKELATTAGLNHARGKAAIMIDADLQHPVELIGDFIKKWEGGADVVVGLRDGDNHDTFAKRLASKTFYRLLSAMAEIEITANATDYRLIDRCVIDHFNRFTEKNRLTRGLIDWLGFRRDFITFKANERRFGTAGYSVLKLIKLAINSFVSHSLLPLRLAGYLGIIIILFSAPMGLFIFVEKYVLSNALGIVFSGSAILVVILLFLVGIVLMSLGLIALYIANIHVEVTGRPLYVIRRHHSERKLSTSEEIRFGNFASRTATPAIASHARKDRINKK
jgi:dolichol-phosphate mannosyltransferase